MTEKNELKYEKLMEYQQEVILNKKLESDEDFCIQFFDLINLKMEMERALSYANEYGHNLKYEDLEV